MSKNKKEKKLTTPLSKHKKEGKKLIPPFLTIGGMQYSSWVNERLPEMLWAALLISHLDREYALNIFRELVDKFSKLAKEKELEVQKLELTMSGIADFPAKEASKILEDVFGSEEIKKCLKPLLLFNDLPARDLWLKLLKDFPPEKEDWYVLSDAINKTLFHQSQEATDCRWVKILFSIVAGKITFHIKMKDTVDGILQYPYKGDMKRVRPSIRSMEIGSDMRNEKMDYAWSKNFWAQCLRDTTCVNNPERKEEISKNSKSAEYKDLFLKRYVELLDCFFDTQSTTAVDSKRDTVFGMACYASSLFTQSMAFGITNYSVSRLVLRSFAEILITLSYLLKKNDQKLWDEFRVYGTGQAKLSLEKLEDDTPGYVDIQALKEIANEDAWIEFVPVNLGHWDGSNLRKLSEEVGLKDTYVRYYEWTSEFMHGNWGAIRETVFQTCLNPLHRLHRIPEASLKVFPDSSDDLYLLWTKIMDLAEKEYPKANKTDIGGV